MSVADAVNTPSGQRRETIELRVHVGGSTGLPAGALGRLRSGVNRVYWGLSSPSKRRYPEPWRETGYKLIPSMYVHLGLKRTKESRYNLRGQRRKLWLSIQDTEGSDDTDSAWAVHEFMSEYMRADIVE